MLRFVFAIIVGAAVTLATGCGTAAQQKSTLDPELVGPSGELGTNDYAAACAGAGMNMGGGVNTGACQKACDAGDGPSCVRLGTASLASDAALAATAFDAACDAGTSAGCTWASILVLNGTRDGDPAAAKAQLMAACDAAADGFACLTIGGVHAEAGDDDLAAFSYGRACELGEAEGCFNLGAMHVARSEYEPAGPLLQKACEGKSQKGCVALGTLHAAGRGVAKDESKAAELFVAACEAGSPDGCYNAGFVLHKGIGVAADPDRAADYLARACDAGHARACAAIGKPK